MDGVEEVQAAVSGAAARLRRVVERLRRTEAGWHSPAVDALVARLADERRTLHRIVAELEAAEAEARRRCPW